MSTKWRHGIWLATMLTVSAAAHADIDCNGGRGGYRMQTSDSWFHSDKLKHFAVSAPFGALGAYLTRDTEHPVIYGTLIGTIPGLIKEGIDGTCRGGGFSYKDLIADVAGALTGALLTNWAITYSRDGRSRTVAISYSRRF
jgi:putative lipoprotein